MLVPVKMEKLNWITFSFQIHYKLLGTIYDGKLKFQYHIENLFKKASLKLSALLRVAPFVNLTLKKILFNAFFSVTIKLLSFGLDVPQ